MTNTAFYKNSQGNINILVDNMTQKDMREEINANGHKVVAIFKGTHKLEDLDQLELNRIFNQLNK